MISDRAFGKEVVVIASPNGDGTSYLSSRVSLTEGIRKIEGTIASLRA
ncbi:MAG: hypothetical protein ACLUSP_10020 [Christensenellales bacterium]